MRVIIFAAMLLLLGSSLSRAAEWASIDKAIAALDRVIGSYPPDIKTDTQKREVIAKYERTKASLDAALAAQPADMDNLLRRANLQTMGHNLDLPGAFKGAEQDYAAILNENPQHERAILGLANMWVNSSPDYAPRAENLFRAAQCLHENVPLEEAQRGLFFAFYYQGRIEDAGRQAEFLAAQWPNVQMYRKLDEMAASVLERQGKSRHAGGASKMVSCG
ncbi:MAG: hypothetical protein H7Z12_13820 [Rhodospirillaceae bacterium]|nr:hypothetical protein [Rhodospirillales bacterium]